jgi:predicted enzyme related to lactoylglutathione lyase
MRAASSGKQQGIDMIRLPRLHQLSPSILMSVLIFCTGMPAAGAADFELPALNTPPSTEHHPGKMVWADLVTPDLAAAEKFYGALFGWTFQRIRAGSSDYAVAMLDGRPIGGIMEKPIPAGERHQSAWLTFMAVGDLDGAKRVATSHGAKVLADSRSYPLRGRQCVLSDPEGAVFAILASSSGDSPDYLPVSGEWIWSSLHAKDAGAEAAFYQGLFGYDVFDLPGDDGLEHLILSNDNYARASANTFAGTSPHRHPHWLNYVRVDHAADLTAKVLAMGGRVLVEPHADRHGGMIAVVADPAGAPFGLMEWTDSDTKAEPK